MLRLFVVCVLCCLFLNGPHCHGTLKPKLKTYPFYIACFFCLNISLISTLISEIFVHTAPFERQVTSHHKKTASNTYLKQSAYLGICFSSHRLKNVLFMFFVNTLLGQVCI